jgi:hypothetical protein
MIILHVLRNEMEIGMLSKITFTPTTTRRAAMTLYTAIGCNASD